MGDTMRNTDFDVVDTLLHDLSPSTTVIEANGELTTCRDTTSDKDCSCGNTRAKPQPKPAPKPQPKPKARVRVRV
jgi:hypothetical protein